MTKNLFPNLLQNQNRTAKPNIVWSADMTELMFAEKKLFVYICIDIHANFILTYLVSMKPIKCLAIVRSLSSVILLRFNEIPPNSPVIVHTDRGTQFTSEFYEEFTKIYSSFILPSMSRANTPIDNSVMERFIRTFKEHKIDNLTIEEDLTKHLQNNYQFKSFRSLVGKYCASLNAKPNRKTNIKSPEDFDEESTVASMLMVDPKYKVSFSELYGFDPRRIYIDAFKTENEAVLQTLQQLAAVYAEVVQQTPFDDYESRINNEQIDKRLKELFSLIKLNPDITKTYVESVLEPIVYSLEELHNKMDQLLPKPKPRRNVLKLRDPLTLQMFPLFCQNAASRSKYQCDLHNAQLVICYTILFHAGLRVNELRLITLKDIQNSMATSELSVIHFKTNEPYVHILSKEAVLALKSLQNEMIIVFEKYKYSYLFGKNEPMHQKSLIRFINNDLKSTCELNNIPFNIKSHSFRINLVTALLKLTTVQNVASIIGHSDVKTTMKYNRYSLTKTEISDLLTKMLHVDDDL
jgi:integrase/recombinase XerD